MVCSRMTRSSLYVQINTSTKAAGWVASQGKLASTSGVRFRIRVRKNSDIVVESIDNDSTATKIRPTAKSRVKPGGGSEPKIRHNMYRHISAMATTQTIDRCSALRRSSHTSDPMVMRPAAMPGPPAHMDVPSMLLDGGGGGRCDLVGENDLSGAPEVA